MTVEIVILSGSRQGERVRIEEVAFQAGDQSTAAIAFDPEKDAGVRGRQVAFRLEDDGWRVRDNGSLPVILNQEELTAPRRIRSGDIVRMSAEGPDFSFHLVGPDAPSSGRAEPPVCASAAPAGDEGERSRRVGSLIPAILVGFLMVFLMIAWANWPTKRVADTTQSKVAEEQAPETNDLPSPSVNGTSNDSPQAPDVPPKAGSSPVEADTEPQDTSPATAHTDSIFLLAVEHPATKTIYPYGSACAIRDDTLLTSATLAVELEKRRTAGWRVLAASPREFSQLPTAAREVTGVQVHRAFQALQESPAGQIFFDLALLSVNRTMESHLDLATAAVLAGLESGQPVVCSGIPHEGQQLTRFDTPSAMEETLKVFFVMPFPADGNPLTNGAPSLLHLEGKLPANMFGSPVFSTEDKVIGVYSERAALPQDMGEIELHYASLVTLVTAWLSGVGRQQWVKPSLPVTPDDEDGVNE